MDRSRDIHTQTHTHTHTEVFVMFTGIIDPLITIPYSWEEQGGWRRIIRLAGPDCAVMGK